MNTHEKVAKILLILVLLAGLAFVPIASTVGQKAQVASGTPFIYGPNNTNPIVLQAQTRLKALGFYNGNLSGLFGIRTRLAVFQFQASANLQQNGILDIPTQNALFHIAPEPEYVSVDYTREGNIFLREWIHYAYSQEGKPVELRGSLILGDQAAFYLDFSDPTNLILVEDDGTQYSIQNISTNDLSQFVGQHVILNGFLLGDLNSLGLSTIIVNFVHEGDASPTTFINYTEDGNSYLQKIVRKYYQEEGEYVDMAGLLTFDGDRVRYGPNGEYTKAVLTVGNDKYSIENFSDNRINEFDGQVVQVRGILLANTNASGMRTIAIYYVLSGDEDVWSETSGTGAVSASSN